MPSILRKRSLWMRWGRLSLRAEQLTAARSCRCFGRIIILPKKWFSACLCQITSIYPRFTKSPLTHNAQIRVNAHGAWLCPIEMFTAAQKQLRGNALTVVRHGFSPVLTVLLPLCFRRWLTKICNCPFHEAAPLLCDCSFFDEKIDPVLVARSGMVGAGGRRVGCMECGPLPSS